MAAWASARVALIASRIMCRFLVSSMVDHFSAAFGTPSQLIMAEYDTRTDEALIRFVSTLPSAAAQILVAQLDEALAERGLLWRNVVSGPEDAMQDQPTPSLRRARGITTTMATVTRSTPLHTSA